MPGRLIVSVDYELVWGLLNSAPLSEIVVRIANVKEAIKRQIDLFERFNLHVTWAFVGALSYDSFEEFEAEVGEELNAFLASKNSTFHFLEDLKKVDQELVFGPQILKELDRLSHQELGSHTFSHLFSYDEDVSDLLFQIDTKCFEYRLRKLGFVPPKSFVFPRNECKLSHNQILKEHGFTNFRGNPFRKHSTSKRPTARIVRILDSYLPLWGDHLTRPDSDPSGLNVNKASQFYRVDHPIQFMENVWLERMKTSMGRAAKSGQDLHLWWHPHNFSGRDMERKLSGLESLLNHFQTLHSELGFRSVNMKEAEAQL